MKKKQIMIRIKEIKYDNNNLDNLLIQENSKFSKITSSGSGASSITIAYNYVKIFYRIIF